jgi:hypothetical protein
VKEGITWQDREPGQEEVSGLLFYDILLAIQGPQLPESLLRAAPPET